MKRWLQITPILAAMAGAAVPGGAILWAPHSSAAASETVAGAAVKTQEILRQPVASDVVELEYGAGQNAVFVAAPDWKDEAGSRVLRLNPETLATEAEIALPSKGFGVALDSGAGRLYLTQPFNGAIAVVDANRNALETRIPLVDKANLENLYRERGASPKQLAYAAEQLKKYKIVEDYPYRLRELAVDRHNGRLFVPGLGFGIDSVLFVVDTKAQKLEKTIPGFGFNAVGIALDEKNNRVFVSNMQGQLIVVDTQKLEVIGKYEIEADQLLNLVYDPGTNRLFGVDQGIDRDQVRNVQLGVEYKRRSAGDRLFALDPDTGKTLAEVPAGPDPISLRLDAGRKRLYVTNRGGVRVDEGKGTLGVYDANTYALLQTIDLPPHPNSLTLGENGDILYVTVKNDGNGKKAGKQESVVRIDLR
ncbi:YncE family protein [Pseudochelatococcus lubricantis]|uniref:YncE family protein n=1 Tax=Pseudochelatococcus lubricantis TaxID=1538102 RepID=UPI0035E84730